MHAKSVTGMPKSQFYSNDLKKHPIHIQYNTMYCNTIHYITLHYNVLYCIVLYIHIHSYTYSYKINAKNCCMHLDKILSINFINIYNNFTSINNNFIMTKRQNLRSTKLYSKIVHGFFT